MKPVVVPPLQVPNIVTTTTSAWSTWPFITISGVSGGAKYTVFQSKYFCCQNQGVDTDLFFTASNITYLLVSLFILYVGIILYVDGDYLYNKVKDFAIRRCK